MTRELPRRNFFAQASSWFTKKTIVEIIALLFVMLFLYAGISKLIEYDTFTEQIAQSPILKSTARLLAVVLPLVEIVVAIVTFTARYRTFGLYASTLLMVLFTGYIIAILSFSKEIPCSCGGILSSLSWTQHLVFNGIFLALGFWGIVLNQRSLVKTKINNR